MNTNFIPEEKYIEIIQKKDGLHTLIVQDNNWEIEIPLAVIEAPLGMFRNAKFPWANKQGNDKDNKWI